MRRRNRETYGLRRGLSVYVGCCPSQERKDGERRGKQGRLESAVKSLTSDVEREAEIADELLLLAKGCRCDCSREDEERWSSESLSGSSP